MGAIVWARDIQAGENLDPRDACKQQVIDKCGKATPAASGIRGHSEKAVELRPESPLTPYGARTA